MKFGLIDFDLTVEWYWKNSWNNKALLNIGDAAEYLVVEQLYQEMGITEIDIVRLSIKDLTAYRGESLIVAMNIALDSYVGYNDILENLSPDIIPVFLGMCFADTNMNEKQLRCLKTYEPVGCRDERSYVYLKTNGIDCYLNGCTASVIDIPEEGSLQDKEGKILFIDVPYKVADYIPKSLKKNIAFLSQEMYCRKEELPKEFVPSQWAKGVMAAYKNNVKLIVTSRFHGAVLALSQNIPAIITLEKYTFRFSWIQNYFPIYTEENFREIDWNVNQIDFKDVKSLIKKIAINRIKDVAEKYQDILTITDLQKNNKHYAQNSSNQVLYYEDALEEIRKKWNKNKNITYAFWGINDNADHLFKYISEEFPNAKLVEIYDMFKTIKYKGLVSKHPDELRNRIKENDFYVVITAYLAARVASDICESIGFRDSNIIMCKRKFVSQDNLNCND